MSQFPKAREISEAAVWSKLRKNLAMWDQLRVEVQAARLRILAELDAYRSRKPDTLQ
jgi:hypothetical protein